MATYEKNGQMTYKDEDGNEYLLFPLTKIECVDGLEEQLAEKAPISHATDKNNPHGVTAAQVGALPITGGTLTGMVQLKPTNGTSVIATETYRNTSANSSKVRNVILSSGDAAMQLYKNALGTEPTTEANRLTLTDTDTQLMKPLNLNSGGTGRDLSTIEPYSIIRAASNSAYLLSTPTADGAFFATGDNKAAKFGTLPVAQGGTGATTAAGAITNLGIKDYVVAQGTLNGWGYRKWNSGIGECWYNDSFATTAVSQTPVAYPYMFTQNFTFPFDFTNNKYTAVAAVTHSNGHGIVTRINHASPNAITILWEGNVANSNAAMSIYVVGKYK